MIRQPGRLTQEDPVGLAGGLNLYGFAGGDPVNFSDPFGLCPWCIVGAIWAAYEIGSAAFDVFNAARTVFSDTGLGQKAVAVGLAVASVGLPGGGFTAATDEVVEGGTAVYRSLNAAGEVQYVGITNSLPRRAGEHLRGRGIQIEAIPGLTNLSRADARAVEQVLIEQHGLGKNGGTLLNRINSIAEANPDYADQLRRGLEILENR